MIRHAFFLQFNSLIFDPQRGRQRIAVGLVAASVVMAASISTFSFPALCVAMVLLLPRRDA
jgi:hypothetical protein